MKKLIAILLMVLMLTACGNKKDTAEKKDTKIGTASGPVVEMAPIVDMAEELEEVPAEQKETEEPKEEPAIEGRPMEYTSLMVDGVVEDTVGFGFEIPVFDCPGNEKIQEYFSDFVGEMESFAKDVVYENAMQRSCIVSVYGAVDSAMLVDDVLSVTYSFRCDYSDAEGVEDEERSIHRFDIQTGEPVE